MNMAYAKALTRQYLEKVGITEITQDGNHIYKGDLEVSPTVGKDGYLRICLYDKELYDVLHPITKKRNAGSVVCSVHRAVYAWFKGSVDEHYVVDHIDNDKTNNNLDNLQLLTPSENVWKGRPHNISTIKCNLNKPLSFYEDKLETYKAKYEQAKLAKDANKAHKLRCNISQTKARIRYYQSQTNKEQEVK